MAQGEDTSFHPGRGVGRQRFVQATPENGIKQGMVGNLVGHDGSNAWFSSESTGGGSTDSHLFPHYAGREASNIMNDNKGHRMVALPSDIGSGSYTLHRYNKQAHGHLPGAPIED